jgi:hypothetical protein
MSVSSSKTIRSVLAGVAASIACAAVCAILLGQQSGTARLGESQADADRNSVGCVACHGQTDSASMHTTGTVRLGCTDCHGGNAGVMPPTGAQKGAAGYDEAKKKAHPKPSLPDLWRSSANPVRPFTEWLKETKEYIQFVNPGDLRVAPQTCGSAGCHTKEVFAVRTSMMTTGAMLWEAALYNNGGFPYKDAKFGESYSADGIAQRLNNYPPPSHELTRLKGVLPHLDPLGRWEVSEPGNILRVFERGGGGRSEIGIPNPDEDPGRPDVKLSERGLGTELRTDPVFLGLQKTRLLDPILSLPGTNDHPGDYRNDLR